MARRTKSFLVTFFQKSNRFLLNDINYSGSVSHLNLTAHSHAHGVFCLLFAAQRA
jgi:hypothetical protein